MNKSESKYYYTSLLMNQALIELLNKKDYDFITITEICKKADVNRSTFYLHYDDINDLLSETIENINNQFLSYFRDKDADIIKKIRQNKKEDLILITPEYLLPYLTYIKEHKIVYQVFVKHSAIMQSWTKYKMLQENILYPIFKRFNIAEKQKKYYSAYYIMGIYAIIDEWIKNGCEDEISLIIDTITKCVMPKFEYENMQK